MALAISRDANCIECREQITAYLVRDGIPYDRAVSIANRFVGNGWSIRMFDLKTFLIFCPPTETHLLNGAIQQIILREVDDPTIFYADIWSQLKRRLGEMFGSGWWERLKQI